MDSYRHNELPSTYNRCKAYTEQFCKWLVKTAESRGITVEADLEDDFHGHTQNRGCRKHKVKVQQFIPIAKEIVNSGVPLDDTSGLRDLRDAIRTRKEVTAWYRHNGASDVEHPFFIGLLIQALAVLSNTFRNIPKEHDMPDEKVAIIANFDQSNNPYYEDEEQEEEAISQAESRMPDSPQSFRKQAKKDHSGSEHNLNGIIMSKDEIILERNFQVLCFLYDFNGLRESVRHVWLDYKARKIGIITAALVTDAAMGIVEKDVTTITQDLRDSVDGRSLAQVIDEIYTAVTPSPAEPEPMASESDVKLSRSTQSQFAQLLCIDGLLHMAEYQRLRSGTSQNPPTGGYEENLSFMPVLLFFDRFRNKKLTPPLMDNFTRTMVLNPTGSSAWLPFGLQILIDIHVVARDDCYDIFDEVMEGNIRISEVMRAHCEYEDRMWSIGIKPDYMSVGETKFSDCFLTPSTSIIAWLRQTLDDEKRNSTDYLTACDFVSVNPVLSGLTLYHFHTLYSSTAIGKIQWFIICFCHLYNACRQIGGLSVSWPDLEYIIEMHGVGRIFVGGRPTDPYFFFERLNLALARTSRAITSEYWRKNTKWMRASKDAKEKRGLQQLFPLDQRVRDYYYNHRLDEHSIRLHNLFAYLYDTEGENEDDQTSTTGPDDLQAKFAIMAASVTPKRRRKRKKNSPVKQPNFGTQDCVHALLLTKMKKRLCSYELHSNFDYLSWYRRAFALVQHIRGEVLFDARKELMKLEMRDEDPSNCFLLGELLKHLGTRSKLKNKNIKAKDIEVSEEVIAFKQLQRISKIMEELIKEEGSEELNNAKKWMRCKWEEPEPEHPQHDKVKSSMGIVHTFTYSSVESRRRRIATMHHKGCGCCLLGHTNRRGFYTRLAGKKKRRVAFRCFASCPLVPAVLGFRKQFTLKILENAGLREVDFDWETDSGHGEWVDASGMQCF